MRIALLNSRALYTDPIENFFQHGGLSLGPFYLEAYLHQYGPKAEVYLVDHLHEVLALAPDLVGISAVTQNFSAALEHARDIKYHLGVPVIVGGPHISALPQSLGKYMDVAVLGEGEETFRQLVLAYEKGNWGVDAWENIEGVAFRKNGQVVRTKMRPPMSPLDRIPKPRRVAWAEELGVAHVMSSRGCPFTCTFCVESEGVSRYRRYSVPVIVEEIKELVANFNVKSIRFFDDVFNINLKHVQDLAAALKAEGLTDEVAFGAWSRASTLNPEMLEAMKTMNMKCLAFGFESGSERVLASLKTATKVTDNQRALDLCYDAGIYVAGNFIVGTPDETHTDLDLTYNFIEQNFSKLASIEITPLIPLPGAPIWDWAIKHGHIGVDFCDWGSLKNQSCLTNFDADSYLLLNDTLTREEFAGEISRFSQLWQRFFTAPMGQEAAKVLYPNLKAARLKSPLGTQEIRPDLAPPRELVPAAAKLSLHPAQT